MNKLKITLTLVLVALTAIATASCKRQNQSPPPGHPSFDTGKITGSTYSNNYFGLTISLPPSWAPQDVESQKKITEAGKRLAAGNNKELDDEFSKSVQNTHMLLTLFKYPPEQGKEFNPSFIVEAEKIDPAMGINTGRDYIAQARKALERGSANLPFQDAGSETLGGVSFDKVQANISIGQAVLRQTMYATIRNGYAIGIIATYMNDDDKPTIDAILKSIQFK